jgi:predicted DNA-binding protein (MmcQ/YjbR family)
MELETLKAYCLALPFTTEEYPFDLVTAVFKVKNKMFAIISLEGEPLSLSLKCDPDDAVALRTQYPAITAGYHLSKTHWNSMALDGSLSEALVRELIDHSYELVANGLKKMDREAVVFAWERGGRR